MSNINISFWPIWLSLLLSPTEQTKIKRVLPILKRAQTNIWRALNIYDDFMDGDGQPKNLPLANRCFRNFLEAMYRLKLSTDFYLLADALFNKLDYMNIMETTHKYYKPKGISSLSDKSLVLALAPLAILDIAGYKRSSQKVRSCLLFFKYCLAAKQLADDSLDWLEDLKCGSITFANKPILLHAKKLNIKLDLQKNTALANLLFYKYSSPLIISELKKLCRSARQSLAYISQNRRTKLIDELVLPHEIACKRAEQFLALVVEI